MNDEAGGVTVFMVAVMALVAVVGIGVVSVGGLLAAREKAIGAAEAAALAAAVATYPPAASESPVGLARTYAAANGASLVTCRCPVDGSMSVRTVTVVAVVTSDVPLFGELAVKGGARAEFDPRAWMGR